MHEDPIGTRLRLAICREAAWLHPVFCRPLSGGRWKVSFRFHHAFSAMTGRLGVRKVAVRYEAIAMGMIEVSGLGSWELLPDENGRLNGNLCDAACLLQDSSGVVSEHLGQPFHQTFSPRMDLDDDAVRVDEQVLR